MEQPPGTADNLQTPQDLPVVVDLTRTGEQCATVRSNPSWYQNVDQSSSPIPFPDTSPCIAPSGAQTLPNNAFSHTTVTLSYVSRSHVFSAQDSLSGNCSVYGIPTFSKYSLQSSCELGETSIALDQPYLENTDEPNDLAAHTDLLQSLAQVQLDLDMETNLKQTHESQLDTSEQHKANNCEHLHNGENIWLNESFQVVSTSSPQCPAALQESEVSDSSKKTEHFGDQSFIQNRPTVTTEFLQSVQCSDSLQENPILSFNSRKEGPESLHGSLQLLWKEGLEALEKLPKTSSPAPLGECHDSSQECQETGNCSDSFLKDKENVMNGGQEVDCISSTPHKTVTTQLGDIISPLEDLVSPFTTSLDEINHFFIVPEASSLPSAHNSLIEITEDLSSTQEAIQPGSEDSATSFLSNDINDCSSNIKKSVSEQLIGLTDDVLEQNLKNTKVLNGNTKALQKTTSKRKLPARSGRGMRLESIVMNINSSRYNVSGCIRAGKKSPQMNDENKVKPRKSNRLSGSKKWDDKKDKMEVSPKKGHKKASAPSCKKTTSGLHRQSTANNNSKALHGSAVKLKLKSSLDQTPPSENSQESLSLMDRTKGITVCSVSSILDLPESQLKRSSKTNNEVSANKALPIVKSKSTLRKKRQKNKIGNTCSMFSPKEPEIRLKYLNYKEEKRNFKTDSFSPFIRLQRKEHVPSLCTVVNYPEEFKTPGKSNQQQGASAAYVSGVMPTTSCLRLGRASMQGNQQRALICCLCGRSANAMDLGDLHGPYYSEGHQPPSKGSKGKGLKGEEESSDSDSSSYNGGRKWAGRSLAAKRARTDVEDWYSPPVVPLGPCEYWFHEDCGVWSAGVFLVRGRVYGLEEAVRAAQSTKCLSCGDRGASLGCLFKGCPIKYHYRCALHSDCVLEEDNFSMKCRRHKNKSINAPPSSRVEPR
ncbi:uncharacterized protein [Eucyclogobius newberryi]|uniref:uncharacterized protein n=1 Tax=Eucyclogobius newberryi TaxID=166745 RepID=UPI003B5BDC93